MAFVSKFLGASLCDGCESIAERVVKDQVTLGAECEDARCAQFAVAEAGEIPIGFGERLFVRCSRAAVVGKAEDEITRRVDQFRSGCDDEDRVNGCAAVEQLGAHGRFVGIAHA